MAAGPVTSEHVTSWIDNKENGLRVTETDPIVSTESTSDDEFQTGNVVTISGGHAVHDTYTAFLPPLLILLTASTNTSESNAGLTSLCGGCSL